MGGNALKNYETRRYSKDEYFALCSEVKAKIKTVFGISPTIILAYKNKESFGDLDILFPSEKLPNNWIDLLKQEFNLTENMWIKNGNVFSFGHNNFQIDLICTPEKEMLTSFHYYSYNDFGNLIGRMMHKLGIKLGNKGLSLVIRSKDRNDHILGEIQLSDDFYEALDILGLDKTVYQSGFDDLEDIFNYVASSKYFAPEIYLLDNRNATSRVRDKKRVTYSKFLNWCCINKPKANFNFERKSEIGGYSIREPYYSEIVLSRWQWVEAKVNMLIKEFEFNQEFSKVYNGNIVSDLTGLTGKELGGFMANMKTKLDKETKQLMLKFPHLVFTFVESQFLSFRQSK